MPQAPTPTTPARLVVLISGGGRTLLNLADAIDQGRLHATIPLVIASRPCAGVERATSRGLSVRIEPGRIPRDRLSALLNQARADFAVLAGYLQFIEIPPAFEGRIVNIHPALLPAFGGPGMYGDRVHRAVLATRSTESGCTVHILNDEYDRGPILLQRRCPVLPGDTPQTVAARVFELECEAYPTALQKLITDRTAPPKLSNHPS
jgi:phosphoribosylglycinamide formyltransferase-1